MTTSTNALAFTGGARQRSPVDGYSGHGEPEEGCSLGLSEGGSSPGYQVVHLQPENLLQHAGVPDQVAQRPQPGRAHLLRLVQERQPQAGGRGAQSRMVRHSGTRLDALLQQREH